MKPKLLLIITVFLLTAALLALLGALAFVFAALGLVLVALAVLLVISVGGLFGELERAQKIAHETPEALLVLSEAFEPAQHLGAKLSIFRTDKRLATEAARVEPRIGRQCVGKRI